MKKVILGFSMVLMAASASGVAHAEARSLPIVRVASVDERIASVEVSETGLMTVDVRDAFAPFQHQLSEANLESIRWEAQVLANAPLKTTQHTIICMIAVPAYMIQNLTIAKYDSEKSVFEDQFKLVLSYESCAVSSTTVPADATYYTMAKALREELVALAREFSGADQAALK